MGLQHSYHLLAPLYDSMVDNALRDVRQRSLDRLEDVEGDRILINGIGTGLDIPHLPPGAHYTGTDLTPAMLERARARAEDSEHEMDLRIADSMRLPFEDGSFDHVIMHLILAVVPQPELAIREASRVLRAGGHIYLLDKFLRPGQTALFRRTLNLFIRHIATRTDVVFEKVIRHTPELEIIDDQPALAGGWFRLIELKKKS